MATNEDVTYDGPEVHEHSEDPARPGITWLRGWYYEEEPEPDEPAWSGILSIRCWCQRPYTSLAQREMFNPADEAAARADLEAVADAHLIERHPQRSLFDGCGCR